MAIIAVGESAAMSGEASVAHLAGPDRPPAGSGEGGPRDGQADRRRADERATAHDRLDGRAHARDHRDVVRRDPGRPCDRRRAVRRRQPRRQAAGDIPAGGRPGAPLLQPSEHGEAGAGRPKHVQVHRRPRDAALPLRARAELHAVPAARPATGRPAHRPGRAARRPVSRWKTSAIATATRWSSSTSATWRPA